ncbi:hypothetical protein T459_04103 [Capsicum annuum]|uniref:Uncharacterized protein n=1 Tax=Capsicum annuum TaxID=4072 RepID=A0A2G3A468_CAPAN|nr:hypothetical protein T459_04103 [Capsicum annuum]
MDELILMDPTAGFGYQRQVVRGMRHGGGPMPNFFMPMVQQGQQSQRPGGRCSGMFSIPYDMGSMPVRDVGLTQPVLVGALSSALANASPKEQRTV